MIRSATFAKTTPFAAVNNLTQGFPLPTTVMQNLSRFDHQFGVLSTVVLVLGQVSALDKTFFLNLQKLEQTLEHVSGVEHVLSLASVSLVVADEDGLGAQTQTLASVEDFNDSQSLWRRLQAEPTVFNNLIAKDGNAVQLVLQLSKEPQTAVAALPEIVTAASHLFPHAQIGLIGAPAVAYGLSKVIGPWQLPRLLIATLVGLLLVTWAYKLQSGPKWSQWRSIGLSLVSGLILLTAITWLWPQFKGYGQALAFSAILWLSCLPSSAPKSVIMILLGPLIVEVTDPNLGTIITATAVIAAGICRLRLFGARSLAVKLAYANTKLWVLAVLMVVLSVATYRLTQHSLCVDARCALTTSLWTQGEDLLAHHFGIAAQLQLEIAGDFRQPENLQRLLTLREALLQHQDVLQVYSVIDALRPLNLMLAGSWQLPQDSAQLGASYALLTADKNAQQLIDADGTRAAFYLSLTTAQPDLLAFQQLIDRAVGNDNPLAPLKVWLHGAAPITELMQQLLRRQWLSSSAIALLVAYFLIQRQASTLSYQQRGLLLVAVMAIWWCTYAGVIIGHWGLAPVALVLAPVVVVMAVALLMSSNDAEIGDVVWLCSVLAPVAIGFTGPFATLVMFPFYGLLVSSFVAWGLKRCQSARGVAVLTAHLKYGRNFLRLGLLWLATAGAIPEPALPKDGNQILAELDAQLEKTEDQIMTLEMMVEDKGHEPRRIGMQMHMRGDRRYIQFLYPGDMKGMRVLNLTAAQSYVYLPAFKKVRRIASHLKEQSMFGSDYSFHDFSTLALHHYYHGKIIAENDATWTLLAKPKEKNKDLPYSSMELLVDKKLIVLQELRYFDQDRKIRTEVRSDYVCNQGLCSARKTKMIDHRKNDHWTQVSIKEITLNSHFSDKIFSLRELQHSD